MARSARLSVAAAAALAGARLLLTVVAVLLAHGLVLDWLARQQAKATALRALATPMFTRLLQPEIPPPAPLFKPKVPVARNQRAQSAMNSIATVQPQQSQPAVTETSAPAPAPTEAPQTASASAVAGSTETTALVEPVTATVALTPAPAAPVAATTPTAAPLDSWPSDTRLNYRLGGRFRSGDLYGSAQVQWQRKGNMYQARVEIDITLAGNRVLTSQGEVTPDGLRPRAYEELRSGKRRNARLSDTEIIFENGRTAPRPEGVQDTASQFVDLGHRFATGREALEVGRSVNVWLARPGAVDLWTYDIVGRELLKTPRLGDVEAFRLKPRPIANPRGNITAEIWFAPSLQYLPVRIRVSMGDEAHVDLMVETIEQR